MVNEWLQRPGYCADCRGEEARHLVSLSGMFGGVAGVSEWKRGMRDLGSDGIME